VVKPVVIDVFSRVPKKLTSISEIREDSFELMISMPVLLQSNSSY